MKKICIIYDFYSEEGGIERIFLSQAYILKEEGYDVKLAFAYVNNKLRNEKLKDFDVIEYGRLPLKNETLQIASTYLRKDIAKKFKDFDLILCHSFPASYLALRIKRKFGIPYILHLYHPPKFLYDADLNWAKNSSKRKFAFIIGKIFRGFLRKKDFSCMKNADAYLPASMYINRTISKIYSINDVVVRVIYPIVDKSFVIKKYPLRELKKFGITKKFIISSGRVVRQKRLDFIIKALSRIKRKDIQLVVAGKYEEDIKKELEELANRYKVEILFLGNLKIGELIKLYNLASATILTCPGEGLGLALVEAVACGCPGIAWKDNSGPQEVIIDGKNGFLAEPYKIEDLAEKIELVLKRKWNKQKVSKSVKKFSKEQVKKEYLSVIKMVEKNGRYNVNKPKQ